MSFNKMSTAPRQHRTAVFVDVSLEANNTDDYYERAKRLITSLNHGATIKAHVWMVVGDNLVPYQGDWENMPRSGGIPVRASELSKWAADEGYTQVVMVAPVGKRAA